MLKGMGVRLIAALSVLFAMGACAKENPEEQKRLGAAFLAENAKKPGVKSTPSGLQYLVIKDGKGAKPVATDQVTVNYAGAFIDGKEFDSGKGISFPLNGVIAGWTEGVQLMQEGAQYRFFIPPQLAYGEAGAGGAIPPNATLVFDVELIKVKR
jgi:FKBP-type peptidyl-prolyl cis-trans isomerase FkpA